MNDNRELVPRMLLPYVSTTKHLKKLQSLFLELIKGKNLSGGFPGISDPRGCSPDTKLPKASGIFS